MTTNAEFTPTLSVAPSPTGGALQPLEQAVAVPGIPTGLECSPQTVKVLVAILQGLFSNTMSRDVMFLALYQAQSQAEKLGVPPEEFERVKTIIIQDWARLRNKNPLSKLFS